jgi:serine/threonine protein kinase
MQEHHFDTLISGRYRLLKRLRRGGMSEVFLALDEQEQQQVAIKIVMNSDADCIKRLRREVYILRKLSHPHILPLLDDGISGPCYYLVMPYMQRGNLRERLAQGKISPQEAGILLHQLADALACAHTHGIIHRDIKPSNILLDTDDANHIYLADFGIAKILEEGSDITRTGFLVGTPEYMAPELAEKPESVSSDIYAVGVLLYQMLAGQLPFTGTTPLAVCWKHIKEQPALPSSLNPEISPAIERVILRAMHKNSRLRFADVGALSLAYANALSGIDEMPDMQLVPPVEALVLPPPQITLSRAKRGFASTLPAGRWQTRIRKSVQRGAVGVAALALLALPVSLGFMVARVDASVQSLSALSQPVAIQRAFTGGTIVGKVVSPVGAGLSAAHAVTDQPKTDLSSHVRVEPYPVARGGDEGHRHKHRH